jgi:hypothetical protein
MIAEGAGIFSAGHTYLSGVRLQALQIYLLQMRRYLLTRAGRDTLLRSFRRL